MEVEQSYRAPHGQKRLPEDDLENEQRLSKRFNLLNLGIIGSRHLELLMLTIC
jgi:hypothetical protein